MKVNGNFDGGVSCNGWKEDKRTKKRASTDRISVFLETIATNRSKVRRVQLETYDPWKGLKSNFISVVNNRTASGHRHTNFSVTRLVSRKQFKFDPNETTVDWYIVEELQKIFRRQISELELFVFCKEFTDKRKQTMLVTIVSQRRVFFFCYRNTRTTFSRSIEYREKMIVHCSARYPCKYAEIPTDFPRNGRWQGICVRENKKSRSCYWWQAGITRAWDVIKFPVDCGQ